MIHLEKIQEAAENLKDVAVHTPLVKNENLSERFAAQVYLKREDLYENEIYIRPIFVNWNFCCIFGLKYKSFNYVVCLKHTSKRDIS